MPKRGRQRSHRATTTSNTYRFFVDPAAIQGERVQTDDAALLHQMVNVLRLAPGTTVTLLDGSGTEYSVAIEQIERHHLLGTVAARRELPAPRLALTLAIALLKGERFEWVLQKGTELGVAAFAPIVTEHSVIDDATSVGATKVERWERIIREAAEQSARAHLPQLLPAQPFEQACAAGAATPAVLLWEGERSTSLRQALRAPAVPPTELTLFSGPEGGWSADEIDTARQFDVQCATLGPRILRAETAPLAAIAATMYEYGEWE